MGRKWKGWVADFLQDSFIPYYLVFRCRRTQTFVSAYLPNPRRNWKD
jgi:hypothetical protein